VKTRHFLQLIAMSALWGASFPLLRIASPAFGPLALAGIRCALAALFGVTWGGLYFDEPVTTGMAPGSLLILLVTALMTGFNPLRLVAWLR